MANQKLHFTNDTYILRDGTEYTPPVYDDIRIKLIVEELKAIYQREQKRSIEDNQLPYHYEEYLLDAIKQLEEAIEWPGDPEDSYGEPPITMAEMHAAAWKEHQETHR